MITPLRVGIDARLLGARKGGISTYTEELVSALAQEGLAELTVFLHRRDRDLRPVWKSVRRVRTLTPPHHAAEEIALSAEIGWRPLDVFHFPDFIPPRWVRGRTVITVHDLAFLHFPEFLTQASRLYYNAHIRTAIERADRIIAVSAATRADLLTLLDAPADRIDVIHEAPRPLFLDPMPPNRHPAVPAGDYILFVGTIEPRKNLEVLLHAVTRLRNLVTSVPTLVVAGARGWLAERTLALPERLGIADRVTWIPDATDEALRSLYHHACCLVLPSRYEGFGLPAVEAMACGCPVVLSDLPVFREIAGGAAFYFPPSDPAALADVLARLVSDAALAAVQRERGRQQAARYSWQAAARLTVETYRRACR